MQASRARASPSASSTRASTTRMRPSAVQEPWRRTRQLSRASRPGVHRSIPTRRRSPGATTWPATTTTPPTPARSFPRPMTILSTARVTARMWQAPPVATASRPTGRRTADHGTPARPSTRWTSDRASPPRRRSMRSRSSAVRARPIWSWSRWTGPWTPMATATCPITSTSSTCRWDLNSAHPRIPTPSPATTRSMPACPSSRPPATPATSTRSPAPPGQRQRPCRLPHPRIAVRSSMASPRAWALPPRSSTRPSSRSSTPGRQGSPTRPS